MNGKRLTIRNSDGTVSQPTDLRWADALEKLARYEDAEEEGRMLTLPCKPENLDLRRVSELIAEDGMQRAGRQDHAGDLSILERIRTASEDELIEVLYDIGVWIFDEPVPWCQSPMAELCSLAYEAKTRKDLPCRKCIRRWLHQPYTGQLIKIWSVEEAGS